MLGLIQWHFDDLVFPLPSLALSKPRMKWWLVYEQQIMFFRVHNISKQFCIVNSHEMLMWLIICLTIDPSCLLISYLMFKKEFVETSTAEFILHVTLNDVHTFTERVCSNWLEPLLAEQLLLYFFRNGFTRSHLLLPLMSCLNKPLQCVSNCHIW